MIRILKKGILRSVIFVGLLLVLAGCGGGSSSGGSGTSFWAVDFTTGMYYQITAVKVGEGVHCQIYLEQGKTVDPADITSLINEFDNTIYPAATTNFGSEPKPGVDNDTKIYILLLDIKDGYKIITSPSYVAGYFDPGNEYALSLNPQSNQKEMFYMDIFPAVPGSSRFYTTLAHEFQHMIHWQQEEVYKYPFSDAVWLNEAMSEVAPVYCGYGPSYDRLAIFEEAPSDSLTVWGDSVNDYGIAYMWGQYFKDHFGNYNIFRKMLLNSAVGAASVNAALAEVSTEMGLSSVPTFTSTFHNWAIAVYSGNTRSWPDHPEWSYKSLGTWTGLAPNPDPASLLALGKTSLAIYSFTPASAPTGSITWLSGGAGTVKAALADESPVLHPDLVTNVSYTYLTAGYLILSNSSDSAVVSAGTLSYTSLFKNVAFDTSDSAIDAGPIMTPKAMLERASSDPALKRRVAETGEPEAICIHSYLKEKEKPIREKARKQRGRSHD